MEERIKREMSLEAADKINLRRDKPQNSSLERQGIKNHRGIEDKKEEFRKSWPILNENDWHILKKASGKG